MKKSFIIFSLLMGVMTTSCTKWLEELPAGTSQYEDYYVNGLTVEPVVNGCYVPMGWEFNGNTFMSEWFIGDICSDDALKGGQNLQDNSMALEMENFQVNADNGILNGIYDALYVGIQRCNQALYDIPFVAVDEYMSDSKKARYQAEAKALRAMYYLRLVRIFGEVPYIDFVIEGSDQWNQQRTPLSIIYPKLVEDLRNAIIFLPEKSDYEPEDLGRITKGGAKAILMLVYLTGHKYLDDPYGNAFDLGNEIVSSKEYNLFPNFFDNFLMANENGIESVFEIQYTNNPEGDYGNNFGFTSGTLSVVLQRARSLNFLGSNTGWGFNRPSPSLYNAFESGDPRRDLTIYQLKDSEATTLDEDIYMGTLRNISLKYAMMQDGSDGGVYTLSHATRGPINRKAIRYADVLLMFAEAAVETNELDKAKELLMMVRDRASGNDRTILPAFPNYNGYSDNIGDLREAIRHERRVELAMEGHRWFDLARWGELKNAMDAFQNDAERKALYEDVDPMQSFKVGVHELFPIPAEEIRRAGLTQNNGY